MDADIKLIIINLLITNNDILKYLSGMVIERDYINKSNQ